ncbi:MAG TPA: helix-turn-helix transcriptional regulator [Polyangiaceae bacterium]|nr:helix-turn-helix transcriptional regulator [Polyangiaceae bacterium]
MPGVDLAVTWRALLERRLTVCAQGNGDFGRSVVTRVNSEGAQVPLKDIEITVLGRVLAGEQQKAVAFELGIACSTTSKWYTSSRLQLKLMDRPTPLPLVIAAQASTTRRPAAVDARSAAFMYDGELYFVLTVPRPTIDDSTPLTQAERMVAALVIEGVPRWEIAGLRGTSAQTVACQLRGIYSKYRLTGRHALIARAVELGWFAETR